MTRDESSSPRRALGPQHAFTQGVRLRASRRTLQDPQPQPLDGAVQLGREDSVAIVQQVRLSLLVSDHLAELLQRPLRGRMRRHVKVNQATAVMFDNDEHVQGSDRAGYS